MAEVPKHFCGHCQQKVGRTVFYAHKKLYFNKATRVWLQEECAYKCNEEFVISDHAEENGLEEEFDFEDREPRKADNDGPCVFRGGMVSVTDKNHTMEEPNDDALDTTTFFCNETEIMEVNEDEEMELWFDEDDDDIELTYQLQVDKAEKDDDVPNAVILYIKFILLWQSLYKVSDTGINVLLAFFRSFLAMVSRLLLLDKLSRFMLKLPQTLYDAKKKLKMKHNFTLFATCQNCSSIHHVADSFITMPGGQRVSKRCDHIEFPLHPQVRFKNACGNLLMKNVRSSSGSTYLYPRSIFCYRSLMSSLQSLLNRADFLKKCQDWKFRNVQTEIYSDIYDGNIWKSFQSYNNIPFLSTLYNFGFSLNVDWFQPYTHTQYSLGAIYLAVLNLPRAERYRQENVVLIGIIPGPKEPKKHMNTFLRPLVEELKMLWDGVGMKNCAGESVIVRGALLCVACDIPAARKVAGFVGPMALHGCSKCMLEFPTEAFGEKPDFSNFKRDEWLPRSHTATLAASRTYQQCKTKKERLDVERTMGVRYSVLHELPYFDSSRMTVIDPMHNLLLGTAKYLVQHWKEFGIITAHQFEKIQETVDSFITPSDIGRIPLKISSGFAGFTADQWKNWIAYYSLISLKSILPFRLYRHWHMFVKACCLLCKHSITKEHVQEADELLHDFCKTFIDLYGKQYCTPNLHLHGHLAACIVDYGPVYAFWLFSFERLNGILGSYHTNNHEISVQVMRRFVESQTYRSDSWPTEFKDDFFPLISKSFYSKGSLQSMSIEACLSFADCMEKVVALPPMTEFVLDQDARQCLLDNLRQYYSLSSVDVRHVCSKAKAIKIGSFVLGSECSKFKNSSRLLVSINSNLQVVLVSCYLQCKVLICDPHGGHDSIQSVWMAVVSNFERHPCFAWFGNPVQVWSRIVEHNEYYLPISLIKSRIVYTESQFNFGTHFGNQTVFVAVPELTGDSKSNE